MQKYNNLLKKSIKKKYKGVTIFENKLYDFYILQRNDALQYIKKKKNIKDIVKKNDSTYKSLKKIYISNQSKNNEKKILIFYQKFENHLCLKISYNIRFKKLTNTETSISTYVFLGLLIYKNKFLNKLQKINCILKILDKILKDKQNINLCNHRNLLLLINIEKKYLKKIIYEK